MTATNYDRYSRWARIGVWLAILTLLVFIAAIAHAAVSTSESQTVTLLRGGSTLATATSWEDCRAKALADAAKSTATTGTVTYTCQSEKRKVIATYSVTPPPIDPPPVVDPPPSTGSPLGAERCGLASNDCEVAQDRHALEHGQRIQPVADVPGPQRQQVLVYACCVCTRQRWDADADHVGEQHGRLR
jgi:hypothetical protein